jgi:hypothetical protein
MRPKPQKVSEKPSIKIGVVFTKVQVEFIDKIVNKGELGGSRAEVLKQIVMFYLRDWERKETQYLLKTYQKSTRQCSSGLSIPTIKRCFGKTVLDLPKEEGKPTESKKSPVNKKLESIEGELPEDYLYPIRIMTRDRTFDWDIKTEADLGVIDSVINSIKSSWKSKKEAKSKQ